jgi:Subtilase family
MLQTIGRCLASRAVWVALGLALALPAGHHAVAAGFGLGPSAGASRWAHPGRPRTGPWAHARGPFGGGGPFRGPGGPYMGHPGVAGPYAEHAGPMGAPGGRFGWSNRMPRGPGGGFHNPYAHYGDFRGGVRNPGFRNGDIRPGFHNGGFHNGGFRNAGFRNGIVRPGFFMPPVSERRFVTNEVVLDMPSNLPPQTLNSLAQRHHLTRVGAETLGTSGHTLYRWRVEDSRPIADVIRDLQNEDHISAAQPNFTFTLQEQGRAPELREGDPAQYAVAKLQLPEAHRLATGDRVPVAVIDSAIDVSQPELKGDIAASFDAVGGAVTPHAHGTAMAGAIAAHGRLIGVAPRAKLLAVRAFGESADAPQATTFSIIRGLDWAVAHGARVVNMSFAGPEDPALRDALADAHKRGVVLVAAAGNAGPQSPPLYPAADQNVIAVTATDANDQVFKQANRGAYIAVSAPGVDILVPAPNSGEQLTSGTSVSAAQVSGIVALLIERNPALTPDEARTILTTTATPLGQKSHEHDVGAGLANAWRAVLAVEPKSAASDQH